jgi:hypothetical protein
MDERFSEQGLFSLNELMTVDPKAAKKFYGDSRSGPVCHDQRSSGSGICNHYLFEKINWISPGII